jgi:hypothetical protein
VKEGSRRIRGERLSASSVTIRKASGRENPPDLELTEGKNRETPPHCAQRSATR